MHRMRPSLAIFCVCLLLTPAMGQASPPQGTAPPGPLPSENRGFLGWFERPYQPRNVPPVVLANSNRLESLLRAGNLYLSMQDCIALVLENNLDIAIQRYGPPLAREVVRRAQAGAALRS